MTKYQISTVMLVVSTFCLALSWGMGLLFDVLMSWLCVLLAGQVYAAAVYEERDRS